MAEQGDEERHSSHMKASDEERIVGGSAADGADASSRTGGGNRGRKSSTALQGRLSHEGSGRSKGSDLAKRLVRTLEELVAVEQEGDWPEGLQETAEDLSSARVMNHPDRDVRQLVACCLVEVLRIYAPEAPYTSKELLSIFSLIVTQLRGLCTAVTPGAPRTVRTFHILESLSTAKSCLIVANMVNERVPGGQEVQVELFEVLLTGIRPEHSQEIVELVQELLRACMEELDVVFQALLDMILIHLLPVTRVENPISYNLAKDLLKRFFARVHKPISQFVNTILTGATAGSAAESELAEHIQPLVYELHKVDSNMLLHILPSVAAQLQAEEEEVRSDAVTLLGRLFSSTYNDYGTEVPKIWMQFLGRFKDLDSQIRCKMVEAGVEICKRKPALRADLHTAIGLRLQDPDWEVRSLAVRNLVNMTDADPRALPKEVIESIGERIKDRKQQIRKDACTGLGKAYANHISSKWLPGDHWAMASGAGGGKGRGRGKAKGRGKDEPITLSLPPAELEGKLGWVPGAVVKAVSLGQDLELRARVLVLLDEYILPRSLGDEARATGLAHLRSQMEAQARTGLTWILQDKKKVRGDVLRYLDARDAFKGSPKDKALGKAVETHLAALLAQAPTPDGKLSLLQRLNEQRDNNVFRLLRLVCSKNANPATASLARADLIKKLGSKTALGEYVKTLTCRCCVLAVGTEGFRHLCLACVRGLEEEDEDVYLSPLELLETLCGVFPEQARGQVAHLGMVFQAAQDASLEEEMSRVLALIAAARRPSSEPGATGDRESEKDLRQEENEVNLPDGLLEALVKLCTKEGTPAQVSAAVGALASLADLHRTTPTNTGGDRSSPASSSLSPSTIAAAAAARSAAVDALRQVASARSLSVSNARAASNVSALAAFACHFPKEFARHEGKAFAFASARVTGEGGGGDGAGEDEVEGSGGVKGSKGKGKKRSRAGVISPSCQTLCASMGLLCNCLLASAAAAVAAQGGGGGGAAGREEELLKAVFGLLDAGGQPAGEEVMSAEERAELRLAGARCVARLCMLSGRVRTLLTPERWHSLAWTLMDPVESVRTEFMREVCRSMEEAGVATAASGSGSGAGAGQNGGGPASLRFMAYLSLVATEAEPLRREAKATMMKKVRQLRRAHEQLAARNASSGGSGGETEEGQEGSSSGGSREKAGFEASMPEYVLPYAIHLLAHHPDFPVDKNDTLRMKKLQRYLSFLLAPLVEGTGGEADNLSLLLQMLDIITSSYQDALEPSSDRIHLTARVARQIVRGRIRTESNLQPYPGTIFLPAMLFQRRSVSSGSSSSPTGAAAALAPPDSEIESRVAAQSSPLSASSTPTSVAVDGSGRARNNRRQREQVSEHESGASSPSPSQRRVRPRISSAGTAVSAKSGGGRRNSRASPSSSADSEKEGQDDDDNHDADGTGRTEGSKSTAIDRGSSPNSLEDEILHRSSPAGDANERDAQTRRAATTITNIVTTPNTGGRKRALGRSSDTGGPVSSPPPQRRSSPRLQSNTPVTPVGIAGRTTLQQTSRSPGAAAVAHDVPQWGSPVPSVGNGGEENEEKNGGSSAIGGSDKSTPSAADGSSSATRSGGGGGGGGGSNRRSVGSRVSAAAAREKAEAEAIMANPRGAREGRAPRATRGRERTAAVGNSAKEGNSGQSPLISAASTAVSTTGTKLGKRTSRQATVKSGVGSRTKKGTVSPVFIRRGEKVARRKKHAGEELELGGDGFDISEDEEEDELSEVRKPKKRRRSGGGDGDGSSGPKKATGGLGPKSPKTKNTKKADAGATKRSSTKRGAAEVEEDEAGDEGEDRAANAEGDGTVTNSSAGNNHSSTGDIAGGDDAAAAAATAANVGGGGGGGGAAAAAAVSRRSSRRYNADGGAGAGTSLNRPEDTTAPSPATAATAATTPKAKKARARAPPAASRRAAAAAADGVATPEMRSRAARAIRGRGGAIATTTAVAGKAGEKEKDAAADSDDELMAMSRRRRMQE